MAAYLLFCGKNRDRVELFYILNVQKKVKKKNQKKKKKKKKPKKQQQINKKKQTTNNQNLGFIIFDILK